MNTHIRLRVVSCALLIMSLSLLAACSSMKAPAPPAPISAPAASRSYSSASEARIQDRPGLGTEAGYEHHSQLITSRLIRKSNVPDAVDSFHYNDQQGAETMVSIIGGGSTKQSGLFEAAGGRLKTGLAGSGIYPHLEAAGRRIVIGTAGSHYRVRLENRTKKRIEVIVTVDGLNTLTGKAASYAQRGYILEPREGYDVDGFRKNATTVSAFRFGHVADSVAATKGGAGNVGVIGLAVFEENEAKARAELQREQLVRENANAFPVSR